MEKPVSAILQFNVDGEVTPLAFRAEGNEFRVKRIIARRKVWSPWTNEVTHLRIWAELENGSGAVLLYQNDIGVVSLERIVPDIKVNARKRSGNSQALA